MRKVVVTGAVGLLGRYVVEALAADWQVQGFDMASAGSGIPCATGSILDIAALEIVFEGADAVVHLAAAANIGSGTHAQIIELNARGSWNVLDAALRCGVKRVVLCSTDSVMGNTVWRDFFWRPDALPVDENHAMRPADPYGLSKLMAEEAGRSFARRGLEVIALRPVFVLFPSMEGEVRARQADPSRYAGPCAGGHASAGGGFCWHHIDPRDLAEAFRLALDVEYAGFEAFYLCAPSTLHSRPTLDRIRDEFGQLPERIDHAYYDANPYAPMFDTRHAKQRLGWWARHDHRASITDSNGGERP